MVAIAILGILATVGVPSFVNLIKNNRLAAQSADFTGALYFARSEAIKRNANVAVVSDASGWAGGWDVVVDPDGASETLRVFEELDGGNTLTCSSGCSDITFSGAGTLKPEEGRDFVLCDDRNEGRKFTVRITGSVKVDRSGHGCGAGDD
jgi:type IV fimbrial biogenesis protein FimT